MGPAIKGNPLYISVLLLVISYIVGEFIIPKYNLFNLLNLIGIIGYCRNPMYLAFILFHFNMFLTFEYVGYFLSSLGLFFWINSYVIPLEEKYLEEKFKEDYQRYLKAVKKWMFF